jgi:hypothetical protein
MAIVSVISFDTTISCYRPAQVAEVIFRQIPAMWNSAAC